MNTKPRRRLFRMIVPSYPAFNIYTRIADITTSLGAVYVASSANRLADWDVEIIDENNCRKPAPIDADGHPDHPILQAMRPADVVGIYGGLTSTIPRLFEIATYYHSIGVTVIVGGQHFCEETIPEAMTKGIDYIVLGEGEQAIMEFLTAWTEKRPMDDIQGLVFQRDGKIIYAPERTLLTDFSNLPEPDFALLRYTEMDLYPIDWVRGCGMNCEFCTVKGKARAQPIDRVFRQFVSLVEKHNARYFFIVDDLFGQHRTEAIELLSMLTRYQKATKIRLGLSTQIRLDKARDTELLQAMRKAGVNIVLIGIESPIEEELVSMNKRLKPIEMIKQAKVFHHMGFVVHGMFIFGYPRQDKTATFTMPAKERVRWFRKFIHAAKIDTVQILLPVPLPGTAMTKRLRDEGRVYPTETVGWEYYDGNFPLFTPDPPITPEEMQVAMRKIMGRFYQFHYMFEVGLHVLIFPAIVFELHNLKAAWSRWKRGWRNSIIRFGGWVTLQRWNKEFNKGVFTGKLNHAKQDQPGAKP